MNSHKIGFIVCIVYIIVYIVLKVMNEPNFEFYTEHSSTSDSTLSSLEMAYQKKLNQFLEHEKHQADQNRRISDLKRLIDTLRNDLVIIQQKDKDEITAINGNSSIAEVIGSGSSGMVNKAMNGQSGIGGMVSGKKGLSGNNYNLNFNLEDE